MFHDMQKKEKIMLSIIAGLIIIITGLLIAFIITINNNKKNGNNSDKAGQNINTVYDKEKSDEKSMDKAGDNKELASEDCMARAEFVTSNTWESNGRKYAQVDITVRNTGDKNISEWNLKFLADNETKLEQNWNCDIKETDENGKWLALTPVQYNREIITDGCTQGIGMIISTDNIKNIDTYLLTTNIEGQSRTLRVTGGKENYTETSGNNSGMADADNNGSNNDFGRIDSDSEDTLISDNTESGGVNYDSDRKNSSNKTDGNNGSQDTGNNGYSYDATGRLHVSGTHLVDESGNYVWLRGVSTHGLAWYPQYVNEDAFRTLRDDWNVNVVRLAMYTAEYGGYCNGGDRETLKELVDKGVRLAAGLGMYVIIDWHILSDSNPNQNKSEAIDFFSEMAEKYAGYNNVIYEICNEPQNSDWNSVIRPYAEDVISTIRRFDDNAVIIVGTNTWSQDVDAVIGNELDDDNVMYALHFYAATHKDWIRNKLVSALDSGVPVIVSECSICDASGNGSIDYDSAEEWMQLLKNRGVGVIAWSLSNKNESASLINPGCDRLSDWDEDDLSQTGKWFRNEFKG